MIDVKPLTRGKSPSFIVPPWRRAMDTKIN